MRRTIGGVEYERVEAEAGAADPCEGCEAARGAPGLCDALQSPCADENGVPRWIWRRVEDE